MAETDDKKADENKRLEFWDPDAPPERWIGEILATSLCLLLPLWRSPSVHFPLQCQQYCL